MEIVYSEAEGHAGPGQWEVMEGIWGEPGNEFDGRSDGSLTICNEWAGLEAG